MPTENDPVLNPDAITWDDLRAEFGFTEEEEADISRRRTEMARSSLMASEEQQN